jgi:hypothetical protein
MFVGKRKIQRSEAVGFGTLVYGITPTIMPGIECQLPRAIDVAGFHRKHQPRFPVHTSLRDKYHKRHMPQPSHPPVRAKKGAKGEQVSGRKVGSAIIAREDSQRDKIAGLETVKRRGEKAALILLEKCVAIRCGTPE